MGSLKPKEEKIIGLSNSLLDPAENAYVKQIWGMYGKILYLEAASLLESKTLRSG